MFRVLLLSILLSALHGKEQQDTYDAFDQYLDEYSKIYSEEEYAKHQAIFFENLATIEHHNRLEDQGYKLGVNQFTDMEVDDVPMGYVKTYHLGNIAAGRRLLNDVELESIIQTEPVSTLPKSVDWRKKGITTPVKNQHMCGSCWAFASTAVIESHVARRTGTLFALSEQELVSCAPNPLHCGGTGGCAGSTAEIAMEYVRKHGMVDEWAFGYESSHGATVECTLEERATAALRGGLSSSDDGKNYLQGAVAGIDGWVTLRNNYTAVMNAIAKLGPLSVTVACSPWVSYKSGIYSGSLKTHRETDINHMVVLEGYGTDDETGEDYWLVRNSWGPKWGESGYIRLKRVDPAALDDPEEDCGIDVTPADGVDCTIDENGNPVSPPNERICGNSGILYDVTVPLGAHLI